MSDHIEFVVKNPAKVTSSPYKLRAKLSSTVLELKDTIRQEYDGQPDTQTQTLIYAGKVLREDSTLVKDFIHQVGLPTAGSSQPQNAPQVQSTQGTTTSGGTSTQRAPPPQVHVPTQLQPQNAAMVAAYQAALNAYITTQNLPPGAAHTPSSARQHSQAGSSAHPHQQQPHQQAQPQQQQHPPQQQQQQHPHTNNQQSAAHVGNQAAVYPMHPPHMLAYVPVLVPASYAAMPVPWAQQQQQQEQQAGQAGQPHPVAPYPYPYPYPPGLPVMLPFGMPQQQGGPVPIRVQLPGGAFPGIHPNAELRGGPGMGQGVPGGIFRMRRVPGMQVRMVRIDLKALLQVAVAGWVVYQHCPPGRFLLLVAVAGLIYLTGLTPLRQMLQRLAHANLPQAGRPAPAPAAAAAAAAPNEAAPAAPPQWTFLAELQAVVVGFISSLIPGWNMNADDAAAFAAAQQMQAAEAAREAQRQRAHDQPNLHQD